MPRRLTAGFVLAGGLSSRMGRDKASLRWQGDTLLVRAVNVVQTVTQTTAVIGNPEIHLAESRPVIRDRFAGAGPLGGIEAALAWSPAAWNLVVACDMPGLNGRTLRAILDQALNRADCDAVVPRSGGRFQPLCAVYHQRALPAIEAALDSKTFKIMEALRAVRVFPVEIAAPDAFRNVNTPEEWDALLAETPA